MRNILLTIAYDGTAYYGWQIQSQLPTVQGEIESALRRVTGRDIRISGTGRTDRGVHAYGQCATFSIEDGIPTDRIAYALNNALPGGIRIIRAEEKPEGFHARFDAKGKTYRYRLLLQAPSEGEEASSAQLLYLRNYVYCIRKPLDQRDYEQFIETPTNQIFVVFDHTRLKQLSNDVEMGFWENLPDGRIVMRIATSWATRTQDVDALIELL